MMSGAESPSPSSSPQPTRESNELQNDSDSLDTRNGEEINLEEDPDQYEERFRVDRRKLEQMLHGNQNGPSTEAEDFFLEVMESTNTQITWPSKLKKGAKSKKDPHIKVQGDPENVKKAKEKIMAVLDTKSNRVTLKMDVSHTEHSHVIGKGGNNIKRVMEDTRCHIHFPDSNRNNQSDKSNQVSIAGQPYGVECARMKIRELLPIAFIFDIPLTGLMQIQLDQTSPVITRIQQQYNVTVVFKQRPRALSTMAVVRGTVLNAKALKEATLLLMEHLTGNVGTLLPVSLQLEVAAQHHLFMVGRGGSNLQQIMAKTGASICFPDLTSGIPSAKGTILISGSIDNVLTARECIIGCLPLVLMFDLKEDVQCDQIYMNALMEKLDVFISVKPKPKQPSKSVVVKSIEENVANMYEARRLLLGLKKEEMPPQTASTRINTHITPSVQGLLAHNLLNIATAQSKPYVLLNQHPLSPLASPRQTAAAAHLSAAVAAAVGGQTNPNWLAAAHGLVNPALMMIPTSVAMNGQQHNIHEIRKAMTSSPAAVSPTAAQVQTATPYTTIVKDLNENSSLACNANITSLQHSPNYINTPTDHKSQFLKSTSTPASPQHLQTANRYSPGNGSCAINGGGRSHSPNTNNMSSLVNQQQQQQPQSMIAAHQPPSQAPLHNHMDLELLTKTLKKDLNLNSSGAHLMEMGQKLHRSGSGADLRGIHQRAQQVAAARSPAPSRRSFSLSMSLNASRGSVSEAAAASMNGSSDLMYDKKAPGIERLADRMLNNDRLMASAHDRLMSSQNERLMASANRNSLMKPPPGLVQPAPNGGAVNPANVSAALADYERKKVMASKAIEQEPSGETRNPTDFWSGLGFSRSMPDSVIRDRLKQNGVRYDGPNMATTYEQQESDEDGDPWKDSSNHGNQQLPQELINKIEVYGDILSTSLGRTTNPIEPPAPPPPQVPVSTPENSDMAELFRKLGLDKYTDLFLQQEIDLATFATLNDQDLKELGISTFGARKKMLLAIADLQKSRQKYFSPTPGSNNPFRSTSASDGPFPFRHDMISRSGRW